MMQPKKKKKKKKKRTCGVVCKEGQVQLVFGFTADYSVAYEKWTHLFMGGTWSPLKNLRNS